MAKVYINEESYESSSVVINNGRVIVNGREIKPDDKVINIRVEGNIDNLKVDYCSKIDVVGNVTDLNSVSGDIAVNGNVKDVNTTSGDIEAINIEGDIETVSGDVKAETINGNVKTLSGDIKFKK